MIKYNYSDDYFLLVQQKLKTIFPGIYDRPEFDGILLYTSI